MINEISDQSGWEGNELRQVHADFGELTFYQLAELRHRGAFSTVSKTYAAWCISCTKSKVKEIADMPGDYCKVCLLAQRR